MSDASISETNGSGATDVGAVLDAARFRGLPLLVMIFTAIIMVLDGFDIQIIGFAAPAIALEFGITRSDLAPALAASLIGMAIGAFTLGPVGDRIGRRNALLLSVAIFGACTLATAFTSSVTALTAWRFVTGLGLGGALPNATALMAEFAPPRVRSQAIAASIVGVPVGGMIGAAIGAEVIPAFGWRAMFVLGGALPLVALVLVYFVLPESPRFLVARRPERKEQLASILNRVIGTRRFTAGDQFVLRSDASLPAGQSDAGVFSPAFLRDTIAVWVMFAANLFAVYCFFNWTPVVLTSLGLDLGTAVRGSLVFNTAGVVGSLACAWVISRLGSRVPIAVVGLCGAVAVAYVGQLIGRAEPAGLEAAASFPIVAAMLGIAVAGFAIVGVQVALFSVAANVYPTACRSSGVGWAAGIGRLGAVISAFAGAALMASIGVWGFFFGVTGVLLIMVTASLLLRRHIARPAAAGGFAAAGSAREPA